MGFISFILIGLIAGALARFLMPGQQPMGIIGTALLGMIGSLAGGFIAYMVWRSPDEVFHPGGLLLSTLGAFLVLWIYVASARRQGTFPGMR